MKVCRSTLWKVESAFATLIGVPARRSSTVPGLSVISCCVSSVLTVAPRLVANTRVGELRSRTNSTRSLLPELGTVMDAYAPEEAASTRPASAYLNTGFINRNSPKVFWTKAFNDGVHASRDAVREGRL